MPTRPRPDTPSLVPLTLTVEETGSALRIGRSTAYEAVRTGAIPTIRIGKRALVPAMWVAEQVGVTLEELAALRSGRGRPSL